MSNIVPSQSPGSLSILSLTSIERLIVGMLKNPSSGRFLLLPMAPSLLIRSPLTKSNPQLTSDYTAHTTASEEITNYQKQIANRRSRVYLPQNRVSQSQPQGQSGLQYSHIEREKARQQEKLEEAERREAEQREAERREMEQRLEEARMKRLKEEARREVVREMNFEFGEQQKQQRERQREREEEMEMERKRMSVVVEEEEVAAPTSTAKKRLSGFWSKKGRE